MVIGSKNVEYNYCLSLCVLVCGFYVSFTLKACVKMQLHKFLTPVILCNIYPITTPVCWCTIIYLHHLVTLLDVPHISYSPSLSSVSCSPKPHFLITCPKGFRFLILVISKSVFSVRIFHKMYSLHDYFVHLILRILL